MRKLKAIGGIFPPSETIFSEGTWRQNWRFLLFVLKKWRLSGGAAGLNKTTLRIVVSSYSKVHLLLH